MLLLPITGADLGKSSKSSRKRSSRKPFKSSPKQSSQRQFNQINQALKNQQQEINEQQQEINEQQQAINLLMHSKNVYKQVYFCGVNYAGPGNLSGTTFQLDFDLVSCNRAGVTDTLGAALVTVGIPVGGNNVTSFNGFLTFKNQLGDGSTLGVSALFLSDIAKGDKIRNEYIYTTTGNFSRPDDYELDAYLLVSSGYLE